MTIRTAVSTASQPRPCCLCLWVGEERCLLRRVFDFLFLLDLSSSELHFFLCILQSNSYHLIFKWTVSKNPQISLFSYLTMIQAHCKAEYLLIQDFYASLNIWQEFAYSCLWCNLMFFACVIKELQCSYPQKAFVFNCSFWIPSWLYSFMCFILISSMTELI